jgi:hypothetical protein
MYYLNLFLLTVAKNPFKIIVSVNPGAFPKYKNTGDRREDKLNEILK